MSIKSTLASSAILLVLAGAASADPELSLPWQLRPVTSDNIARADTAAAVFVDARGNIDIAKTTALAVAYHLTERWAPTLRLGFAGNNAPGAALDGISIGNPLAGMTYTRIMGHRRFAVLAATTIPIGTGGGDVADPSTVATNAASTTARPADDALFAVNYLTEIAGADAAYVNHGITLQAEAMLQQGIRVRGARSATATDAFRTRAALGAHAGVFLGRHVSLGADILYQRWLSHPTELDMTGAKTPIADADLGQLTVSAGVRGHFHLGATTMHPGLSYTRGLDGSRRGPMIVTNRTNAVAVDLTVLF